MSQQVETPHSRIAATYKAREVEGALDVYFYRPLGFRLAEFFAQLPDIFIFTVISALTSRAWCSMSAPMRSIMRTVSLRD